MPKKDLLHRYRKGRVSALEKQIVEEWYAQHTEGHSLTDEALEQRLQRLDDTIKNIGPRTNKGRLVKWTRWVAAAAAVLIVGVFIYDNFNSFSLRRSDQRVLTDVLPPVGDRTTVTLENNQKISLDALKRGDTVAADGYLIARLTSGEIKYIALEASSPVVFNTIETGIGGGTTVILSDGTKLWLNSNSKVVYPTVFESDMREVYLQGEGYFEVVSSEHWHNNPPFYVKTDAHTLRVYGTKFNINTFRNNYVATLFEGKIGLKKESLELGERPIYRNDILLRPSQQYTENATIKIKTLAEPERLLDWKNGYFYLTDQTLAGIAEKLSMWYGVTFKMDQKAMNQKFFGQISRDKKLSEVLNLMSEVSGLAFGIEGKTVFVHHKNQH